MASIVPNLLVIDCFSRNCPLSRAFLSLLQWNYVSIDDFHRFSEYTRWNRHYFLETMLQTIRTLPDRPNISTK